MIEAYIPSPKVYFKSDNAMLYEHLLKEFEYTLSACETVFSQSYMKYANYEKKWAFVVDGFGEDNFREQIYSRMCVYCAEITDNGLIVHRGLHFSMSPLLLFYTELAEISLYIYNPTFGLDEYEESSVIKLLQSSNNKSLIFKIKEKKGNRLLFQTIDDLEMIDDYGEPVLNFPEDIHWGTNPFSSRFKDIQYPVYGCKYHSMTNLQEGSYCVLVARNDNPDDEYTIEVLRWIPTDLSTNPRGTILPLFKKDYIIDSFCEDLHKEMCRTDNQILIAKFQNGKISILGNRKELFEQNSEIKDFTLPISLFNLLVK